MCPAEWGGDCTHYTVCTGKEGCGRVVLYELGGVGPNYESVLKSPSGYCRAIDEWKEREVQLSSE
jgi:hypothetical protein